ncbi:hypothetical protein N9A58_07070, partial [Opitutales bacterium]|nr:hypothetical protein [Opitutales bacterium]
MEQDSGEKTNLASEEPAIVKRLTEALEKFDADGDGKLNPKERKQAMEAFRKELKDDPEHQDGKKGKKAKD